MAENTTGRGRRAFILRIAPSYVDRVPEALAANEIIIGWCDLPQLLDVGLSWTEFRQMVRDRYYPDSQDFRSAGAAAGNVWRFIREMNEGDLVVVPYGSKFYVAR